MIKSGVIFLPVLLTITFSCSLESERMSPPDDPLCGQEAACGRASAGSRLLVEVSDALAEELVAGGGEYDGYLLERIFPEDPEFEERHRAAGLHRCFFATPAGDIPATRALAELKSAPGILNVEIDRPVHPEAVPFNDPYAIYQWHLSNPGGQGGYTAGCDINVVPVWEKYTAGSSNVIVGVVDTGTQYDHQDLAGVVIAPGSNGSRSFLNSTSSDPYNYTPQRHATHVSGIIAAINNNGTGGCGIAGGRDGSGGVRILDLQAIPSSDSDSGNTYNAIVWAADHGAVILNNSWTFSYTKIDDVPTTTPAFATLAIDYFINHAGTSAGGAQTGPMKGGVVFFSAGNNNWSRSQPAMYDKAIAVGATGPSNEAATYSNYGSWVDICAPGGNYSASGNTAAEIYSSVSGNGYDWMQGTSMSCPMVSGVAALLVSQYGGPGFTNEDLKTLLLEGADRLSVKSHTKYIGPLVDAYESMSMNGKELKPVDDATVTQKGTTATVWWAVREYGNEPMYAYRAFIAESRADLEGINPLDYPSSLRSRAVETSTKEPGERVSAVFYSLEKDKDYYYTVAGYTRSGRYTKGNAIGSFRIIGNRAPVLESDLSGSITLTHNENATVLIRYSDPDGDQLKVDFAPGSPAASIRDDGEGGITLSIDGAGAPAGGYTATLTVSDAELSTPLSIPYTILPNTVPVVLKSFASTMLTVGKSVTLPLDGCFKDNDGDALTCSASLAGRGGGAPVAADGQTGFAKVSVNGNTLTIKGIAPGVGSVELRASDGFGGSASTSFLIRVDEAGSEGLSIYPAEVRDRLYITASKACVTPVSITTASGKEIFAKSVGQDPFNPYYVSMGKCAPGIYVVKVELDGKKIVREVVKL